MNVNVLRSPVCGLHTALPRLRFDPPTVTVQFATRANRNRGHWSSCIKQYTVTAVNRCTPAVNRRRATVKYRTQKKFFTHTQINTISFFLPLLPLPLSLLLQTVHESVIHHQIVGRVSRLRV